jgi:hypothetical protein
MAHKHLADTFTLEYVDIFTHKEKEADFPLTNGVPVAPQSYIAHSRAFHSLTHFASNCNWCEAQTLRAIARKNGKA